MAQKTTVAHPPKKRHCHLSITTWQAGRENFLVRRRISFYLIFCSSRYSSTSRPSVGQLCSRRHHLVIVFEVIQGRDASSFFLKLPAGIDPFCFNLYSSIIHTLPLRCEKFPKLRDKTTINIPLPFHLAYFILILPLICFYFQIRLLYY